MRICSQIMCLQESCEVQNSAVEFEAVRRESLIGCEMVLELINLDITAL